jgi:hypothetical protein
MAADGVEVVLDPVDGLDLQGFQVRPWAGIDQFFLVRRERGLGDSIVVTDPGFSE